MKIRTQVVISVLIIVKLVAGSVLIYRMGFDPAFFESNAVAFEIQTEAEKTGNDADAIPKAEVIDLQYLVKKKNMIEEESRRIEKRKEALLAIQRDINEKIVELSRIRNEIKSEKDKQKIASEEKRKHLIKAYSAMKPQSAAQLIEKLDMKIAVEILSNMKGESVGNILSYISVDKATQISERLLRQKE